jgi:hypothetical protein
MSPGLRSAALRSGSPTDQGAGSASSGRAPRSVIASSRCLTGCVRASTCRRARGETRRSVRRSLTVTACRGSHAPSSLADLNDAPRHSMLAKVPLTDGPCLPVACVSSSILAPSSGAMPNAVQSASTAVCAHAQQSGGLRSRCRLCPVSHQGKVRAASSGNRRNRT